MEKNRPASAGDTGLIWGWQDPLEEEMAARSCTLAWGSRVQRSLAVFCPLGCETVLCGLGTEHMCSTLGSRAPHARPMS